MCAVAIGLPTLEPVSVTRRLCAALYLDSDFSDTTYRDLCTNRVSAIGPSPGVDLVALARHGRKARREHRARLIFLTACAAGLIFAVVSTLWAVVLLSQRLFLDSVALCLTAFVTAWLADGLFVVRWKRIARRLITQTGGQPREGVAPLREKTEQVLQDVNEAKVVIHAESAEGDPFIGTGVRTARKVWEPIDISRPSHDSNGRAVQPFTANDLLQSLAGEFPMIGLKGLSVREVLFVRGNIAQLIPELWDDADRPRPSVSPDDLPRIADRCADEGVRRYLRVQIVGPNARFAVTMHVRPTIAGDRLTFHVVVHVLPPLHKRYFRAQSVPAQALKRSMGPFLKWPVTVLRELQAAPMTLLMRTVMDCRAAAHVWQARRIVRRGKYLYDVGDSVPVRVRVCDPKRMADPDINDAIDWLKRINRALLDVTEKFLQDHNISTFDLRRNRNRIIAINYNIEKVTKSNLGDNGIIIDDSGDSNSHDDSDVSDGSDDKK